MRGLAIITDDMNMLDYDEIVKWCKPLEESRDIGAIPIFECQSLTDYSLVINGYKPGSVILTSTILVEKLYGLSDTINYSIRVETWGGEEVTILICPDPHEIDWERLELALDRLEEIL